MEILTALGNIKQRPEIYFGLQPTVTDLFTFLMGWDMASDTKWCRGSMELIGRIKRTGSGVPGPDDISFHEAIDTIIGYVREHEPKG